MRVQLTCAPPVTPPFAIMRRWGCTHGAPPTLGPEEESRSLKGCFTAPRNRKGVGLLGPSYSHDPFADSPLGPYKYIYPPLRCKAATKESSHLTI